MIIKNKLKIDLVRRGVTPLLDAIQNDANARSVEISLLENGSAWTVPDGVTAAVSFRKSDGTSGLYDTLPDGANAVDIGDSKIKFIMAPQMLTVPGLVRAAVVLIKDTVQVSTFPLDIHVAPQPGAGAEKSENYYHYTTFEAINNAIGNLDDLQTTDKSSLVGAINEVKRTGGTGGGSSDSEQNGNGLTTEQINALDNMFKVCAFIKEDVSAEYNAFCAAFGIEGGGEEEPDEPVDPEVTLTSISAVYDGGDVAVGTAVADLTGLVVTAHYSDGTSQTVTGYTLSGTIAEGSNTVTVTYQGKTATFTVTGVAESGGEETTTPFGVAWTEGILILDTKGTEVANATWAASDYIDLTGKTEIRIYNDTGKLFAFQGAYYDANKNYISGFKQKFVQGSTAYPSPLVLTIPTGCSYVRVSTGMKTGSETAGYVHYTELTYELA